MSEWPLHRLREELERLRALVSRGDPQATFDAVCELERAEGMALATGTVPAEVQLECARALRAAFAAIRAEVQP